MKNEQEQFLTDIESNDSADLLEQSLTPPAPEPTGQQRDATEDEPEDQPESVKDRRHRRLEEKLRAERESNIALASRLETLNEARNARTDESAEYLKSVERIYGTQTPETAEATELLKTAFKNVEDRATERAVELLREERRREEAGVRQAKARLDSMVEEIEDTYNVSFTPSVQTGFFKYLEKMSPKDSDGNIIEYADHHSVWESYQSRLDTRKENKAKDLSARSMVNSGASSESTATEDPTWKFLKKEGW